MEIEADWLSSILTRIEAGSDERITGKSPGTLNDTSLPPRGDMLRRLQIHVGPLRRNEYVEV